MNKESHIEPKKPQNKLKYGVNYINVDYLAIAGFNFTKCVYSFKAWVLILQFKKPIRE